MKKIKEIERKIELLYSALVGLIGKDKEGIYRQNFVKKILKLSEKKPKYRFANKNNFLNQVDL